MRFSRFGVIVLLSFTVLVGTNCTYYNRVMARKDLVDGSNAYKDRKFPEAQRLFRSAVARDPNGNFVEGQTAQLFLARTLHSEYIGNRQNRELAEQAIAEYQKALQLNPNDQSSYKAIASLYENLQMNDQWLDWVTKRSSNTSIPPEQRGSSCEEPFRILRDRVEQIIIRDEEFRMGFVQSTRLVVAAVQRQQHRLSDKC